ncbi:MAG: tripartite tricarboxylate transporter substrate-binding protein [Xanthobacteraceae bacterium]
MRRKRLNGFFLRGPFCVRISLFKRRAAVSGAEFVHVPYCGSYMPDLIAGRVQICISPVELVIDSIRSGKLRPLGVTTTTPLVVLPNIPTINHFLPGCEGAGWNGVGAPQNTPNEIVELLNKLRKCLFRAYCSPQQVHRASQDFSVT